jgi:DNA-binding winged helix-turn-helix (wHTH) protein/tetratricopeptide (TPR) repeat protein
MPSSERHAFGDFVLERSQQRVLHRDGRKINLTPRLFTALLFFVDHAGELLGKDTLIRQLWSGVVVEENNLSQVISGLRRALGDDGQGSRFIETVPRIGFRFVAAVTALPDARVPSANALAVLPFKPLHSDGRDELLEVGMADTLAARLSTVPGLVVRSVGSVLRCAGTQLDLERVARDLDVAWIVDGSLQRRGDELRVTSRLLRTSDGTAAWSASFDERFTRVFDVQDQISHRLKEALLPVLQGSAAGSTTSAAPASDQGGTRNIEAYRLYLAACAEMLHQRADGLRRSIALFNQALDLDPGYALAWTGLADAHRRLAFVGEVAPAVAYAEVDIALRRALALAPNLGEAHASLGQKLNGFDFDWPAAELAFRHAMALNPNVALAHFLLGQMLLTQDRIEEGFVHLRLARELDPMHPLYNVIEASFLLVAGRTEEGRVRLARAFEIAPGMPLPHLIKAQCQFAAGQTDDCIASLRQAVALAGGATVFDGLLGFYLGQVGHLDEARRSLDRLQARAMNGYVAATSVAAVHAGLGEVDAALTALERAYEQRDSRLVFLKDAPYWTSLRTQPRFLALMKKLRLDRYGPGIWNP